MTTALLRRRHLRVVAVGALFMFILGAFILIDRLGAQQEAPLRGGRAVSALECPQGDLAITYHGDPVVDGEGRPVEGYPSPEDGLRSFLEERYRGRVPVTEFRRGTASDREVQFVLERAGAIQAMLLTTESHGVWLVEEFVACNSLVAPASGTSSGPRP